MMRSIRINSMNRYKSELGHVTRTAGSISTTPPTMDNGEIQINNRSIKNKKHSRKNTIEEKRGKKESIKKKNWK